MIISMKKAFKNHKQSRSGPDHREAARLLGALRVPSWKRYRLWAAPAEGAVGSQGLWPGQPVARPPYDPAASFACGSASLDCGEDASCPPLDPSVDFDQLR